MEIFGGDGGVSSPLFRLLHDRWLLIPPYTESLLKSRALWLDSLGHGVASGSALVGGKTTRGSLSDPLAKIRQRVQTENPLHQAIARIHQEKGRPLSAEEEGRLAAATQGVPQGIARNVALLLHTALDAVRWRDLAFRHVKNLEETARREDKVERYDSGADLAGYDLVLQVDYSALFSGAAALGFALDEVIPSLAQAEVGTPFSFRWESPLGVILLSGSQEDNHWGDDHYRASHEVALGAGHDFSLGFFMDDQGDDDYEAGGLSLGAGHANGIGVFVERSGNDVYQARRDSLGFAGIRASPSSLRPSLLCVGLFLDLGGEDTYPGSVGDNGKTWVHTGRSEAEKGLGVDGEYPDIVFPLPWASGSRSGSAPRP